MRGIATVLATWHDAMRFGRNRAFKHAWQIDSRYTMIATDAGIPERSKVRYRVLLPVSALCAFAVAALLHASGHQLVVARALSVLGVATGESPFLDTHAVLAAAECQRLGHDVWLLNPCDALGRPHVYSPLWLAVVPSALDTSSTPWVGATLGVLFILSLPTIVSPRSRSGTGLFALAVFSPMTLYALERGNNDLVIFLLVVCVSALQTLSRGWRLYSYALVSGAALLKYYPAVLLALVARESRRDAILVVAGTMLVVALVAGPDPAGFGRAMANIPQASYYTDSFSAQNLPFGLVQGRGPGLPVTVILFGLLLIVALARARRTTALLATADVDWTTFEMRAAVMGSLLLTGCFFAGQNVDYRGIYFLFVLPGLLQLRGANSGAAARKCWSRMIAAVLFVMWGEFFRRALLAATAALPAAALRNYVNGLFWISSELVWWWLIASLAAVAAAYLAEQPLVRGMRGWRVSGTRRCELSTTPGGILMGNEDCPSTRERAASSGPVVDPSRVRD